MNHFQKASDFVLPFRTDLGDSNETSEESLRIPMKGNPRVRTAQET